MKNSKKLLLLFFFLLVNCTLITANSSAQWVAQSSGTNQNLYDVEFINQNTGWAVGDAGVIIKTTNAGNNWFNVPNPSGNYGGLLWSIFPVDSEYVYVTAGYDFIMKSTNGGSDWDLLNYCSTCNSATIGVYFLNRDTGWFLATNKIFRTYDGGQTLDSFYTPAFDAFEIYFKDINTGIFTASGKVFKSTNGGENWFQTNLPTGIAHMFRKLAVVNDNVWVVAGSNPPVYKSTNFGDTWERIDTINNSPSVMISVAFANEMTGWSGGTYGYIYKTVDGGYNWTRQITPSGDLSFRASIYTLNDSVVYSVGGAGRIIYTNTGGEKPSDVFSLGEIKPTDFYLYQNFPNPFNPVTSIKFDISKTGNVNLLVYDILGKEIKTLVNENLYPGSYQVSFNGESFSSGIYYYRLSADGFSRTMKMILIK